MEICKKSGNGVCINCDCKPSKGYGDICRKEAELLLDAFVALMETELTEEQVDILQDFGAEFERL